MNVAQSALAPSFVTGWYLVGFPVSTKEIKKVVAQETEQTTLVMTVWNTVVTDTVRTCLTKFVNAVLEGSTTMQDAAARAGCSHGTVKENAVTVRDLTNEFNRHLNARNYSYRGTPVTGSLSEHPGTVACAITEEMAWTPCLVLLPFLEGVPNMRRAFSADHIPYLGQLVKHSHVELLNNWGDFGSRGSTTMVDRIDAALGQLGLRLAKAETNVCGEDTNQWWTDLPDTEKAICVAQAARVGQTPSHYWVHTLQHSAQLLCIRRHELLALIGMKHCDKSLV